MGASSSKPEGDKALQLCRERKKFVRQALDGRCSLAALHIAYIEALKSTGTALRNFLEPESVVEPFPYTSTSSVIDPDGRFLLCPANRSQRMDVTSPVLGSRPSINHMKFSSALSRKVEEKPAEPVIVSITSATSDPEKSRPEASPVTPTSPPWDFFGLPNPFDNQFYPQDGMEFNQPFEDHGQANLRKEDENSSTSRNEEETKESEDEFEEPPAAVLVRSFENVNRITDPVAASESPEHPPVEREEASEINCREGERTKSGDSSTLRVTGSGDAAVDRGKEKPVENKTAPMDLLSSMRSIEQLFSKASDSGREVPRMLEANKFNFRPIFPGKTGGSIASALLTRYCFSCGDDPSQAQEDHSQSSVKYLTWHRTASSRLSFSRDPPGANPAGGNEGFNGNVFDSFCMTAGSHASTLDRLYAWEKKLYDEVKASETVRREYDLKCKILRRIESRARNKDRADKTRAVVKDLHSRVGVSIHRIDAISRRIEELRDKELQPQLEELIEGLRRMWDTMSECHKHQFRVVSASYIPGKDNTYLQSDSRRQITIHLANELGALSSSFMRWINAQKAYVEAINRWIFKCVSLAQRSSRRNRRQPPPNLRHNGPPIYALCGVWLEKFNTLPAKEVLDSVKALAAEVSRFLPLQDPKNKGDGTNDPHSRMPWQPMSDCRDHSEGRATGLDHFQTTLARFLSQLNKFAESSLEMYMNLQNAIQEAKRSYKQSEPSS